MRWDALRENVLKIIPAFFPGFSQADESLYLAGVAPPAYPQLISR